MPGKRKFEEQLAAIESLREQSPEARVEPLRMALEHRNNFVVSKAADLVRAFQLIQLIPELLSAFDRFMLCSDKDDPVKTDPQCWAKTALSRALAAFEYQDEALFLRGMKHIQLEPVWGGTSDSAGTLRATCALALVQCRNLREGDLLAHLIELSADKDKSVRIEVVRAIEQVASPTAALLLRQRAILGADDPEVLGACHTGILHIEGVSAIPWVSRFLDSRDDAAAEAALAIAGTHSPDAFRVLRDRIDRSADPWFVSVLLSAIALTRQDAAQEFLLDLVRTESRHAEPAIEAILRTAPSVEITKQMEELVAGNQRLARSLAKARSTK